MSLLLNKNIKNKITVAFLTPPLPGPKSRMRKEEGWVLAILMPPHKKQQQEREPFFGCQRSTKI